MNFYQQINSHEDMGNLEALENVLDWLEKNPHGLKDAEERKRYVKDAIDSVLNIKKNAQKV